MTALSSSVAPGLPGPKAVVIAVAALLLAAGATWIAHTHGWEKGALYLTGGALGVCLYHAGFGFTGSWRAFLRDGRGGGIRAQMIMLALASAIFIPAIDGGMFLGRPAGGAFAPVGVSVLVGAFLFGIGMQIGGGCASGTLYTAGGGNARMAVTLIFFVAGSVIGSAHLPWWLAQPSLGTISLGRELGSGGALALQLGVFAAIYAISRFIEQRRHGHLLHAGTDGRHGWQRLLRGPWPLIWGAVGLALFNALTLWIAGHPWSVTFGFSLWGAKILSAAGMDVAAWEFWTWPYPSRALNASVLAETTSVMNIGIVLGALLASGAAGRFAPSLRIGWGPLAAAVIGGLLLGYGARLAFGCNIGALFSGIASGSGHGWLWLVAALAGNWAGSYLRPVFRLSR